MPWTQEINRRHPALFVFLLDQSAAMAEPVGGNHPDRARMMDELAKAVNAWLSQMTVACTKAEGVRHYVDVAVIGYRTDGKTVCSIVEINDNPDIRSEQRAFLDEATGQMIEWMEDMPVWVDPKAEGEALQCWALHRVQEVVEQWIAEHRESYPPIVIHYTSGKASDGDPLPYAEALMELETQDGHVLLFNCLLTNTEADPCLFPHCLETLPDPLLQLLFRMSSELPAPILKRAVQAGEVLQPGARGLARNADLSRLTMFLDIGYE
jgi:hypothetical protein